MNRIDTIRKKKRLSYTAIAKRAGFSTAYIQQLAQDKRTNPSLEAMKRIAAALDEKVETVFLVNRKEDVSHEKI